MVQSLDSVDLKTKLTYSHGIEIENHLTLKETGTVLIGKDLLTIWEEMFNKACIYLNDLKDKKKAPQQILNKIVKIEVEEIEKHERKLKFVFIHYKLGKETVKVNVFGPDPNISQITWLLELVTPPCEYLEELDWWIKTLYNSAIFGLQGQKPDVVLLPIGLNPTEERFRSGLSCGSHHHIGVPDHKEKIAVYNMFRNFVPHLIALSASSPFINQAPKGTPKIRELNGKKQIIGRYTHSNRLANNTGQIGPNIPEYLPILQEKDTKEVFSKYVKKTPPDDRMVDVYPFTDYNTIELRFFDAQPFTENRLAIVLLLQALALKAKNLLKSKSPVPTATSSVLFDNRQKSIETGLLSQYTIDPNVSEEFSPYYNFNLTTGKKATRLLDSVTSLILYVKDELLQFANPEILNYLLIPILGTKEFEPPFALSEYLISEYLIDINITNLFSKIFYRSSLIYPLQSIASIDSMSTTSIDSGESETVAQNNLTSKLQKDMQSRKKEEQTSKEKSIVVETKKKSSKKPVDKLTKVSAIQVKKSKKEPIKSESEKPQIEKEIPLQEEEETTVESQEIPVFMKGRIAVENNVQTKQKEQNVISAFDQIDETDIFVPAIEIEPKYTKIESKIANVMRKRREDIEIKKKDLYREHLERDRVDFKPTIKNVKFEFPGQISGKNVFGFVIIEWQKISVHKLRNNPIYFYFSGTANETGTNVTLKTVSMMINVQRSFESSVSRIPLFFSIEDLTGDVTIEITAVTATNELLFKNEKIKFKRKDEINVKIEQFFINGDYGPVECTFQLMNVLSRLKADFDLFLAIPDYEEIKINSSSISIDQNEFFQNFNFVDLDATYHGAPFYLVAQISTGRLKKTNYYEAIRIKPTKDTVVQWDILSPEGKPDFRKSENKNSKFDLKFVFNFTKKLPPVTIEIFMNTLPEGSTKNLLKSEVKRQIDENDGYMVSKTIKLPKNCEYIYFDVEITTKKGFIPIDLISDPLGYPVDL